MPQKELEEARLSKMKEDEEVASTKEHFLTLEKTIIGKAAITTEEEEEEHYENGELIIDEDIMENIVEDPSLRSYLINKMIVVFFTEAEERANYAENFRNLIKNGGFEDFSDMNDPEINAQNLPDTSITETN
uniref:Uncharacterized protein n=1 Tax=Strombidium inclinatum TaxID=197538 RepID=A0A7S3MZZ3_9SPIT|mmetsp:Transcript_42674/g.65463  ORF Transcript_42674/g.65463 Transcript_42674/m.65463 type:complete len:132 (+) Transcript_42674:922-1317(+)